MICTAEDITEQKKFEEELRKFKFISDNSNDAHYLADSEARFVYVNKMACQKMGYTEDELLKLSVLDVDIQYDVKKYKELFRQIHKTKVPPFETTNKAKDGHTWPVEISSTGIEFAGKKYMFAVARDISKRKEDEDKLEMAKKEIEKSVLNWKNIFNSVKDMIMVINKDFKIIKANESMCKFLNKPLASVVGKHCYRLVHNTNKQPNFCPTLEMIKSKKHTETEVFLENKGIWVSLVVDPVFDEKNNLS